jgi:diguanylate cyclase (GGDEF)-like protein
MPETPHGEGKKIAERLRTNIAKTPFGGINAKVRITASLGVAAFPKDASNLHDLIDGADRALYQAKSSGRNQTCLVSQISKTVAKGG